MPFARDPSTPHEGINVLVGLGDGTFATRQAFPIVLNNNFPESVRLGDLNLDGKVDVVVGSSSNPNQIGIYVSTSTPGSSTITFANNSRPTGLNVQGSYPRPLDLGDLNSDGYLDLAVALENGKTVEVFMNLADNSGSFAPSSTVFTIDDDTMNPKHLLLRDINGDTKRDIIVSWGKAGKFSVFINTTSAMSTTPTFGTPSHFNIAGTTPWTFDLGDINSDGKLDIAVAICGEINQVDVLINTTINGSSTPTFSAPTNLAFDSCPTTALLTDITGDGKLDLAVAQGTLNGSSFVSIKPGQGDGSFGSTRSFTTGFPPNEDPWGMVAADFNGDGRKDLATASWSEAGQISVHLNGVAD